MLSGTERRTRILPLFHPQITFKNFEIMSTRKNLQGWALFITLIPILDTSGQPTTAGARSASLAGITTSITDVWSVVNNPSELAGYRQFSAATSADKRFLLSGLGIYSVATAMNLKNGTAGLCAIFSGYESFIDQRIYLSYGMNFGENVSAGVSMIYVFQHAGENSLALHQLSYQLGAGIRLSEKFKLAFVAFNPFQLYYKSRDFAELATVYRLGMEYRYSSSLVILTEIEKDLAYKPVIKLGTEYSFREYFFIRGGMQMLPFSWSFGAGIAKGRLVIDLASYYHSYLGFSPVLSLQYNLK